MGNSISIWLTGNNQQNSNELAYLYLGIVGIAGVQSTPDTEVSKCKMCIVCPSGFWYLAVSSTEACLSGSPQNCCATVDVGPWV